MNGVGCSTWCLLDRGLCDALDIISGRTGTAEILADSTHDLLDYQEPLSSYSLSLSVHAPTTDLNIASVRERIRTSSLAMIGEVCKKSCEIGAHTLVVHPGLSPWLELKERSFQALLRSLEDLAAIRDEFGVSIAVENMGSWEVSHFRDPGLLPVIRDCGLSFCLDVGHAHLNGMLEDFLAAGRPDHVHLHDNGGVVDDHMPLGSGIIDIPALLSRLPPDVAWILEMPHIEWYDQSITYLNTYYTGSPDDGTALI